MFNPGTLINETVNATIAELQINYERMDLVDFDQLNFGFRTVLVWKNMLTFDELEEVYKGTVSVFGIETNLLKEYADFVKDLEDEGEYLTDVDYFGSCNLVVEDVINSMWSLMGEPEEGEPLSLSI